MEDKKLIKLEQWLSTMIECSNLDITTLKIVRNKVRDYRRKRVL